MLVKELQVPFTILKEEAILRWLAPYHSKRSFIEDSLGQHWAGYVGEKRARYYINLLNENKLQVLHSIRLPGSNSAFQMDYLLITEKVIIILEVKNLSGTIIVGDPLQQCIQIDEKGEEKRLKDPLTQVKFQRNQLIRWLQKHFSQSIPIDYLIVNTHPSAIIKVVDPNSEYVDKFFAEERIPHKVHELISSYSEQMIKPNMIKKLVNLLQLKNSELDNTPLKTYNIQPREILKGILCPQCKKTSLKKKNKLWRCSLCHYSSTDIHQQAIRDYFLIFNKPISNKECREWLNVDSRHAVKRLLSSMNLDTTGKGKSIVYYPSDTSFFRR